MEDSLNNKIVCIEGAFLLGRKFKVSTENKIFPSNQQMLCSLQPRHCRSGVRRPRSASFVPIPPNHGFSYLLADEYLGSNQLESFGMPMNHCLSKMRPQ